MQQLVISKIDEQHGVKCLECTSPGTISDYKDHPDVIYYLGDRYVKTCGFAGSPIIHYRVRPIVTRPPDFVILQIITGTKSRELHVKGLPYAEMPWHFTIFDIYFTKVDAVNETTTLYRSIKCPCDC